MKTQYLDDYKLGLQSFLESNPKPQPVFSELYSPKKQRNQIISEFYFIFALQKFIKKPHKHCRKQSKKKIITSGARETGKATVRDSAKAGESQETKMIAAAAAATLTKPFVMELIKF